jgi:hypothetical protein
MQGENASEKDGKPPDPNRRDLSISVEEEHSTQKDHCPAHFQADISPVEAPQR